MAELTEDNVPKRARELFEKGMIAMERNNLPYAMDMFMAALIIEPRFMKARKFLRTAGVRQFNDSHGNSVTHLFSTLGGITGLIKGFAALKSGKSLLALQIAEQLLRTDSLNLLFIRLLCRAAETAGMPEVAIQTLTVAREFYPQRSDLLIWMGNLYTAANQMEAARECFESVVDLHPNDAQAMKAYKDAMARDSMLKGGWTEVGKEGGSFRTVIKDMKEAVTLEQESKSVRGAQSVELLIQDGIENVKRQPDNINFRRALANLYVEANRFDDAIRAIEESRRIPGIDDSQIDQALAAIRTKYFDSEIAQLRENGDTAGVASKQAEKVAFLYKNIQSRVERYPNDLPLRFEYAVLLHEHDQVNEAIQQFQIAQRYPRNRIRSLFYLGLCFHKKQQLDMAREQLEKALAELPEMNDLKKDILYELGTILESMGNVKEAADRYYKEIYQVDIGYKDVAAKIEAAYKQPHASS
ncbi:MAG: tetratricopeptide repeat protein [Verrucomicrobia bacterium]|nr:tetratricopeptide repeat protein [Verrucomicrobiota bacterium]MCG2681497.1 tetratricopeptide repeat protein [Kiritimatiellia bacterium]MBU4248261.1 tetratricopeptide repeat protein [Verrucomicrobiota bacterium]MBU4289877.1 tetratricopeptide repeat protein [Verrucomicrobiota bacterium]MBU4428176.1 tetratricopeptide repeat protein [Verrucomicrobiota bacterium]